MPKRPITIDALVPLYAWQGVGNRYANVPEVRSFAQLLAQSKQLLVMAGPVLSGHCVKHGFDEMALQSLRARAMSLSSRTITDIEAKRVVDLLNALSHAYVSDLRSISSDEERKKLPGMYVAAISEQVLLTWLTSSGRLPDDMIFDAVFSASEDKTNRKAKISSRNMDVFWWQAAAREAALYECKNQPARLFQGIDHYNIPGRLREWKHSELYLMAEVRARLGDRGWTVETAVVTLRPRASVESAINRRLQCTPESLATPDDPFPFHHIRTFCLEDFICEERS
jgi:hypothetical protein